MLKPETRDLDEWIDGFFKKIGAEQGANDPNTRQRIIMAIQVLDSVEETFQREAEAGGLAAMAYAYACRQCGSAATT